MEAQGVTASMATTKVNASTMPNSTEEACVSSDFIIKAWFSFGTLNLVRVVITWMLFIFSLTGNSFVIWALRKNRSRHFIMFHLALSNIIYTVFVMPLDAVWNTTMHWMAGEASCRVCQMSKQFGMYASSFMVVVIAADRVSAILRPLSYENQKKRGRVMVIVAWCASCLACIPAGALFSLAEIPTCEGITFYQCVDFLVVKDDHDRTGYYFATMFCSFLLPFLTSIISYSLIVCEISNMKERDRELMGRRNSANVESMRKAKRKTVLMRTLISLSFLICWGPYYGLGIYDWFQPDQEERPAAMQTLMYIVMYLNPVLHPFVFGIFMKEIRTKVYGISKQFREVIFRSQQRVSHTPRLSFSTTATGTTNLQFHSRASYISIRANSNMSPLKKQLLRRDSPL